jgi:hypothetical protein
VTHDREGVRRTEILLFNRNNGSTSAYESKPHIEIGFLPEKLGGTMGFSEYSLTTARTQVTPVVWFLHSINID